MAAPIRSILCEKTGIQYPIICGGMHYVGYAEMAAAVSNAGACGMVTALTQTSPEDLRKEIRKCKTLTDKPFGVNVTLLPALAPPNYGEYCKVIIDEGIKIVETAGNKPDEFIKLFKQHGIFVIHKCVTIRHAQNAQKLGVDMLSIDGFECAGHPGNNDIGNFLLLALAAKNLNVPFIASGGVGNGHQLAAALALGAEGINMGTRFMATQECPILPAIKQAIVEANEYSTQLVFTTLNNTERVFKNKTSDKVVELEKKTPGDFSVIRPYVSGAAYKKSFYETGDTQSSVWSCGPVIGLIDDIPTCKVLVERIMNEARQSIKGMVSRL